MAFSVNIEVNLKAKKDNLKDKLSFVIKRDDCKANNKRCNAEKCPMVKSGDSGDRNTFKCGHDIPTIEGI